MPGGIELSGDELVRFCSASVVVADGKSYPFFYLGSLGLSLEGVKVG